MCNQLTSKGIKCQSSPNKELCATHYNTWLIKHLQETVLKQNNELRDLKQAFTNLKKENKQLRSINKQNNIKLLLKPDEPMKEDRTCCELIKRIKKQYKETLHAFQNKEEQLLKARDRIDELMDKVDGQLMLIEEYKNESTNYVYIRKFETLYKQIRTITGTDDYHLINNHLRGDFNHTFNQLKRLLDSKTPLEEFHYRRAIRNDFAHNLY
jgi:hypothetical protein